MSDLAFDVELKGIENVTAMGTAFLRMTEAFEAAAKASPALTALQNSIKGIGAGSGAIGAVEAEIRALAQSTKELAASMSKGFDAMNSSVKNELDKLKRQVNMTMDELVKPTARTSGAITKAVESDIETAKAKIKASASTLNFANSYSPYNARTSTSSFESGIASDTQSTFNAMYRYKVKAASDAEKAIATEASQLSRAVASDTQSTYNAMYRFKVREATQADKLIAAEAAQFAKGVASDTQSTLNSIYRFKVREANQAEKAIATEATQFAKSVATDTQGTYNAMYRYKVREATQAEREIAAIAKAAAAERARAAATPQYVGPYSALPTAKSQFLVAPPAAPVVPKLDPTPIQAVTGALKQLTVSGNDAHSAVRGLASGFNLLWLTWGNLVPLFAGAAISNGFMQTVKVGSQVEHTMSTIAVLGGNTTQEMAKLNQELIRLGNTGPAGPVAIADAMKVLSLAGLKANEILAVTQTVLNFSVAGTTDLKTAADALVSISTAFGMGAAGFERVGDVVSKAAAESKSSVESFAGAMKTASVINAQYGVSLVDTATGIATLSQLGIEGSAAGTALRNMYADLSGRSKEVAKTLKSQGIEMRTATGEFRPMLEVVADLNTKLQSLDGISQKNLMQALLSERGAKGIVEMLRLVNTEARDSGKGMVNALQEMRAAIEDSYGFAAISAAKLSQTTQKQFEAVKATMQTSMVQAFEQMQPALIVIADSLKQAFASPEFINGLASLVTGIAQLGMVVIDNAKFISVMAAAYLAYRVMQGPILAGIASTTTAKVAETVAIEANTVAQVANNGAKAGSLGLAGGLAKAIPYIGTALTVATTAWIAFEWYMASANDTAKAGADIYNNNVVKTLRDQTEKLRALNDLRDKGLTLTEAQLVLDSKAARKEGTSAYDGITSKAEGIAAAERKKLANLESAPLGVRSSTWIAKQKEAVIAADAAVAEAKKAGFKAAERIDNEAAALSYESKRKAIADEAALVVKNARAKTYGSGTFERFKDSGAGGSDRRDATAELNRLTNEYKREEQVTINAQQNIDKVTEAMYKAGALRDDEYEARKLASIKNVEQAHITSIEKQLAADKAAMSNPAFRDSERDGVSARITTAEATLAKAKADAIAATSIEDLNAFNTGHALSTKRIGDLTREIEAQRLKNAEIGKTPAEIELAKSAVEKLAAAQAASDAAFIQAFLDKKEGDEGYVQMNANIRAGYQGMVNDLRALNRLLTEKAALQDQGSSNETLDAYKKFSKTVTKKTKYEGLDDTELKGVIGVETAKVKVYEITATKQLDLIRAVSQAKVLAAMTDGTITADMLQNFAKEEAAYAAAKAKIGQKVEIDISVASKSDVSTQLDGIASSFTKLGDTMVDTTKKMDNGFKKATGSAGDGFKKAGTALSGFSNAMKTLAKAEKDYGANTDERTQAQVGGYGEMAGAAAEFFDKNSAGYEVLKAAEQGFRMLQLALSVAAMAQDATETGSSIGNSLARGAADLFAGVMKMFAQSGWGGFVGAAALIALAVSLGGSGGGGAGGGGAGGGNNGSFVGTGYSVDREGMVHNPRSAAAVGSGESPSAEASYEEAKAADAAVDATNELNKSLRKLETGANQAEQDFINLKRATQGAGQAQYELATKGMSESERQAYNYNAALEAQSAVLMDTANGTELVSDKAKKLAEETQSLGVEFLKASGDIAGAKRAQQEIDTAWYSKEEIAAYNHNQELKDQIEAMNAGAEAAKDAARAEEELANTRRDLQNQIDVIMGTKTQLQVDRTEQLVGVTDGAVISLTNLLFALQDIGLEVERLMGVADAAYATLGRAVSAEKETLTAAYKAATAVDSVQAASLKNLTALATALKQTIASINLGPTRAEAQAILVEALVRARLGKALPSFSTLEPALKTLALASQGNFATEFEYRRDQAKTANNLAELATYASDGATVQQDTLDTLKATYDAEMERLDKLLTDGQRQLDAMHGIDVSVISVAAAVVGLNKAIEDANAASNAAADARAAVAAASAAAMAASTISIGQNTNYVSYVNTNTDNNSTSTVTINPAPVYSGGTLPIPTGPTSVETGFAVGTNYVPYDMPAYVHQGERIIPAAENSELMDRLSRPQENNAVLVLEIRRLNLKIDDLNAAMQMTAGNTSKTNRLVERLSPDGDAIQTRTVAV